MWNVVYNPIERVIAPVIRGNPWGWDPATRVRVRVRVTVRVRVRVRP